MVKWTDHALRSFVIFTIISPMIHSYAKRVSEEMARKTVGLDELPYLGRKVPELNEEYILELGLCSYRIIYEIKINYVEILAVIHKRRDFAPEDLP